jgi:predicted DNA-binding transcriptional regulator YafY
VTLKFAAEQTPISFMYKNYRGETAQRTATPIGIRFGTSVHYPAKEQWLLVAFCHDRQAERSFAMQDMSDINF